MLKKIPFPIVRDPVTHEKKAELHESTERVVLRKLGEIGELNFTFPRYQLKNNQVEFDNNNKQIYNPKWDYITNEYLVEFDNDYYIIKYPEFNRDNENKVYGSIQCKQIGFELNDNKIAGTLNLTPPDSQPVTADQAIASVLNASNSNWELGTVDSELLTKARTFKFEWVSALYALGEIAETFEGILEFKATWDNVNSQWIKVVNLKKSFPNNGHSIRYDKNMQNIVKFSDSNNIVTRLFCQGKDFLSINDQPTETRTDNGITYNTHTNGQSYIDNFQFYLQRGYTYQQCLDNFVKVERFKDEIYVDSADLYEDAKSNLERISMPKLSYSIGALDLSYLNEQKYATYSLGEIIRVYDKDLGVNIDAQIVQMQIDYDNPQATEFEIANFTDRLADVFKNTISQNKNLYFDSAVKLGNKFANSVSIQNDNGITVVDEFGNVKVILGQFAPNEYGLFVAGGISESQLSQDLQTTLSDLDTSVSNLQTDINNFSSDGKLTLIEANSLEKTLNEVLAESTDLISVATSLSITTEKTNYQTALTELQTELNNNWINQTNYPLDITSVQRTTIQTKFDDVQNTKSILINKIAEKQVETKAVNRDVLYNSVKITSAEGVEVFDNNNSRVLQMGSIDTDDDGIKDDYGFKASHIDGTFTALIDRGLIRRHPNGEISDYTSEIYTVQDTTPLGSQSGSTNTSIWAEWEAPKRVFLPSRFQNRDIAPIATVRGFKIPRLAFDNFDYNIFQIESKNIIDVVSYNTNVSPPWVDVVGYTYFADPTGLNGIYASEYREYTEVEFVLFVIG